MYAGRVACCLLVNHGEYADRTDGRTDGQTPDRYFALSARRGQRKKERVLVLSNHDAVIYLLNDEQSVKEYWWEAGGFFTEKICVTPASREPRSRQQQSRWCRYILFAVYTTAVTHNAFKWAGTPKSCPSPWGGWTPVYYWFVGPTRVYPPISIRIGSAVFAGLKNVTKTDRHTDIQTDHATRSVAAGRILLLLRYSIIISITEIR